MDKSNKVVLGAAFFAVSCFSMVIGICLGREEENARWETRAVQAGYGEWYVEPIDTVPQRFGGGVKINSPHKAFRWKHKNDK